MFKKNKNPSPPASPMVFFTKFLVGLGLAFGDDFSVPVGDRIRWGWDSRRGQSQMRGDLEKLPAEAKKCPPTAKLDQILVF